MTTTETAAATPGHATVSKRDFLFLMTGSVATVGAAPPFGLSSTR